jgi:exopolyphosphatase/pppGpp-phosphohydrolase
METLDIGKKTANQGINANGKLTAQEFNQLVDKVNEMIAELNNKVYVSQEEYDALVASDNIIPNVEYNIYEE